MMRKTYLLVIALIAGLMVLSGCEKKSETKDVTSDKQGGTLRYLYGFSPGANIGWPLDDANTQRIWGTNFMYAEPLVVYKRDGSVDPHLATSWEFSPDFDSITFTLREGVKFHDGTDFNADAVKWQLDKILEEKKPSAAYWKSVDAVSDYKVRINFLAYSNTFWADITSTYCMFISPTQFKAHDLDYVKAHPVGTGPFIFVSWARDESMKFKKNPDYWQAGKPYLDAIEFITVKEPMTQLAALKSGDGDILALQSGKTLQDMEKEGYKIHAYPAGTNMLVPDTANEDSIFADYRVREAIDYAINKKQIADALGYGFMAVNHQMPPGPNPSHDPDLEGREYNPDKAKEILEKVAAEKGFKLPIKTQIHTFDASGLPLTVQRDLKKVGIDAEIDKVDNMKFWQMNREGWKGLMFVGYAFGPNFAASMKAFFPPYSVWANQSMKPCPNMKEMIDNTLSATSDKEQVKQNRQLSKALWEDLTTINIASDAMGFIVSPKVHDGHWLEGTDWQAWSPADIWLSEK